MPTRENPSVDGPVFYAVTATLPDEATAAEYSSWLADGHVQHVIRGGAESARVVRLDPDSTPSPGLAGQAEAPVRCRIETQYQFPSRAAFDRYVREVAPRLRADGLERFPASRGVGFERRLGGVVGTWRA